MLNYLKAMIWPRKPACVLQRDGAPRYRYVIVGMLVTDKPIPSLEGHNEIVVDGFVPGLDDALDTAHKRDAPPHLRRQTADIILVSLDEL